MGGRIDKYEPNTGSFRAPLDFDIPLADVGKVVGVGLNASGRVVKGAGQTGIKGLIVPSSVMNRGDAIDVGQDLDVVWQDGDTMPAAAGQNVYAVAATGVLTTTATGNVYIGHTVERHRLVARVNRPTVLGA